MMIGDYTAEFKRGPDKRPRKKRNWGQISVTAGGLGGVLVDTGRRGYQVGKINKQVDDRFIKTGKRATQAGVNLLIQKKNLIGQGSNIRTLKAYGAGAAAGLGAYGAYKLGQRITRKKKR